MSQTLTPRKMSASHPCESSLTAQLVTLARQQFTGRLDIESRTGSTWNLYFGSGRLLYATGGVQPLNRYRRHLQQATARALDWTALSEQIGQSPSPARAEYWTLCSLVKSGRIAGDQAASVVRNLTTEVLFDAMQASSLTFSCNRQERLDAQLVLLSVEQVLSDLQQSLNAYQGLDWPIGFSLHQALLLKKPERLRSQMSAAAYAGLKKLLEGRHTLRDIAASTGRDVIAVGRLLLPYLQERAITLLAKAPPMLPRAVAQAAVYKPLVVCIDDSAITCSIIERIVLAAGYRFLAVQEPMRAFATLVAARPDFLFLDLVMPDINGYELCARLRKSTLFQSLPIVILTGNDGLIDRVRARMTGASDFMSKPVESARVVENMIRKHLSVQTER